MVRHRAQPPRVRTRFAAAGVGLLAMLLAVLLLDAPAVQRLEAPTLDWRFLLRGPQPPGGEVALVVLDEASLEALGGWPPSRLHLAEAVERLRQAEAGVIVFDLLFAETPAAPHDAAADAALATAIAAAGNVILGYAFAFETFESGLAGPRLRPGAAPPMAAALQRYRLPPGQAVRVPRASAAVLPEPRLRAAAAGLGHMSVLLAPDGALRSEAALIAFDETFFPSLALQAARHHRRLPPGALSAVIGRSLSLGAQRFDLDGRMRLPVNFYGPDGTLPSYPLIDLLAGRVPAAALRDKAVVLGSTALAAAPVFVTPYDAALPSVAYTGTVLDNLLTGRSLARPGWLRGLDILAAGLGAALAFALARRLPAAAAPLAVLLPGGGWAGLTYGAFVWWQLWLAVAVPLAAVVLGASWGALARSRAEQRRREAVARERQNLSRYFSPAVAERLAAQSAPYDLTASQPASVLFVDILGFTRLCERLPSDQAIALLRGFHARVERAVFAQGGTLDKYLGDGALAVFGVPDPQPDEAARALAAAVALQTSVAAWAQELAAAGQPPLEIAVGLHHGPVIVGDIGGESRFEFTVLGDTVNVASRLEGLTRQLGAGIVASEAAIERAGATGGIPLGFYRHGEVALRGRDAPLAVWAWRLSEAARGPAARETAAR